MSLRIRLVLAFLAIVVLLVVVVGVSFKINHGIQDRVGHLTATSMVELDPQHRKPFSLEVEGNWEDGGVFAAKEVQKISRPRRPKLRGPIQELDPANRTIMLYGRLVQVVATTQFETDQLADLEVGQRVEVSCTVDVDGQWMARRVKTDDIKPSDKIKGTVTRVSIDGVPPDTVAISGILITLVSQPSIKNPINQLDRIAAAQRMRRAVEESLHDAHEVVRHAARGRAVPKETIDEARTNLDEIDGHLSDAKKAARTLATSQGRTGTNHIPEELLEIGLWLDPLGEELEVHRANVEEFLKRLPIDVQSAEAYLRGDLETHVHDKILPVIEAYLTDAEEDLSDEVETISAQAGATTRLLLITSFVAIGLAVLLGGVVWRSISKPVLALKDAAERIGAGHLDTRVEIRSNDELGVLGETFNQMAEQLADSTVSIKDLKHVEGQLRDSLSEKEILLREVHHRVKNNLQVISSLLDLQSAHMTNADDIERFSESQNRIRSMALIHEQLYRAADLGMIDLREYLEMLSQHLMSSAGPADGSVKLRMDVGEIRLDIDRALTCGLIINELLTNALKHAFDSNTQGDVTISFQLEGGASYVLIVADSGRGIPERAVLEPGGSLGMTLVTAMVKQLRGALEVRNKNGSEFRIVFPADVLKGGAVTT